MCSVIPHLLGHRASSNQVGFVWIFTEEFGLIINTGNVSLVNSLKQGGQRLRIKSPSNKILLDGSE